MATQYAFGKIVTDGLVLSLDAADRNSYVSGSTIWNDMSGRGNTGNLISGSSFNSANGGVIVFDGIDDYVLSPNQMSVVAAGGNATIEAFVFPTTSTGVRCIFNLGQDGSQFNYGMVINGTTLFARNSNLDYTLTGTVPANIWSHIAVVYTAAGATGYINGIAVGSNASAPVTTLSANAFYVIGRRAYNNTTELFTGRIGLVRSYQNRALSASEIRQNYNAQKSRFGLT